MSLEMLHPPKPGCAGRSNVEVPPDPTFAPLGQTHIILGSPWSSIMSKVSEKLDAHVGLTLTFLGCGTLGTAILQGILESKETTESTSSHSESDETPKSFPEHFIGCVRRPESAKRIRRTLASYKAPVTILENQNLKGVQEADVVILGCKPYMVAGILGEPGMREALKGKLLISICAGLPVSQIEGSIYGSVSDADPDREGRCRIVRVMPNTAAFIRESMTVIATSTPPLPGPISTLVTWIFTRIGRVVQLPPSVMDASTALCGSGPAFMALVLEAMTDGGLAMGIPRAEAQMMAAQVMKGTAGMVLNGEHPASVREKVSTPGGCTIGGLLVLEEGGVRGSVARSVREATVVASQLGKGVQNVNGTRF